MLRRVALGVALLSLSGAAASQTIANEQLDRYAKPARLVALPGGRTLNLDCRGKDGPTVLLLPGLSAWTAVWAQVHDRLAAHHRTCAFDPAGFGHSGPSPEPQDAAHIATDLEAALKAAGIAGPYIVVGHSAGGLQALLFADSHKRDLAGLVLIEPTYPGQIAEFDRDAPTLSRSFHAADKRHAAALARCATALETGPLSPSAPEPRGCFDFRPDYSESLRAALAAAETPARMRTKIAQIKGINAGSAQAVDPTRDYGATPLIVLTRGFMGPPPGAPPASPQEAADGAAIDRDWIAGHDALAKLSRRGEHRTVPGAGHIIQRDAPDAVVAAIEDVAK